MILCFFPHKIITAPICYKVVSATMKVMKCLFGRYDKKNFSFLGFHVKKCMAYESIQHTVIGLLAVEWAILLVYSNH
jgi:hypothetical protein